MVLSSLVARGRQWWVELEITPATRSGLYTKGWSLLSSPLTVVLLLAKLSPVEQGYYYSFISAVAFQALGELGLGSVLTQVVARGRGSILNMQADGSEIAMRVTALIRTTLKNAIKWYVVLSLIGATIVLCFGYEILLNNDPTHIYFAIFCAYALLSVSNLFYTPFLAIHSGAGKNDEIARLELIRQVLSTLLLWVMLSLGCGIWALVAQQLAIFLINTFFIHAKYKRIYRELLPREPVGSEIDWRKDILPLQSKVALMAILGAASTNLASPLLLNIYGPIESGRFGITQNIGASLAACAAVWFIARLPELAHYVGARDGRAFLSVSRKIQKISLLAYAAGAAVAVIALLLLTWVKGDIAGRFIDLLPLILLLLDGGILLACTTTIYSARCFGKEYFLPMSFGTALVAVLAPMFLAPRLRFDHYLICYFLLRSAIAVANLLVARKFIKRDVHFLLC